MITKFKDPVLLTQPLLPSFNELEVVLSDVWNDKWLTNNGKKHQELEKLLKNYLKVPYLSLFNNGTTALMIAIQSLKLNGQVITTPFTFPATPHALAWNGITPVFCDVDPDTMNIDAAKIESLITPNTTGILAVHVFGVPCDVPAIQNVATKHGLRVVYDAAHAFGVEVDGTGIGTFGDITMFSFHATKLFHTAEGGALSFGDPNLKQHIGYLRNFGIKNEDEVVTPGINGKLNEIQASMGLLVLKMVENERIKRQLVVDRYVQRLKNIDGIVVPDLPSGVKPSLQYFVIRINKDIFGKSRDHVYSKLKEFNVFARKYFYPLCSNYPCYKQLPSASLDNLRVANQVVDEVLALPLYGNLEEDKISRICDIINEARKGS